MGLLTRVAEDAPSSLSHAPIDDDVVKEAKDLERGQHGQAREIVGQQAQVKENDPRTHLKAKLKSLLAKYNGCTKNTEVAEVVQELAALNPIPKNCSQSELFEGDYYTLTAPTFPGRLKPTSKEEENIVQYTLGRLSFNIFQPHQLVCTLRSLRNPVHPRSEQTKDGRDTFSYHFVLDITIHTPDGDLPATMINEAYCYENPDMNNRFMVAFKGGTLMPAEELVNNTSKLKLWQKTFEGAYQKADQERSYLGWFFQYILKLFLGLTLPSDTNHPDILQNTFHFDMKRSPTGHMDVLYLDEDVRITKGNRGTIVVAERAISLPPQ